MPKLEVTDDLVHELILEVGPLVSQVTGWDLQFESLRSRVVPRDQGYEEILLGRFQQLGLAGWKDLLPGMFERLIEYMVEQNTLAAYMPGAGEILVVRENVDDSNLDGLKLVLAHELVHRGQHVNRPELFEKVDALLRQSYNILRSSTPDLQAQQQVLRQVQPLMTLMESHASYVHRLLRPLHFPHAQVESHFNVATLLMRLVGGQKLAQYTDGLPRVARAARQGSIEALYNEL